MASPGRVFGDRARSPPIKVLSCQLRDAKTCNVRGKTEYSIKRLGDGKSIPLQVTIVWMQGTVVEVQADHNTALLLDQTGNFIVNGINDIPKGNPCLIHGKYVMVMGIVKSHCPEPVLRAVKMADLSGNAAIHRTAWKYEVEDLQQTLP